MARHAFTIPRACAATAPLAPEHSRQIAERMDRAHRQFAETLQEISGCTLAEARAVTRLYLKHKLARLDAVIGRITVKHGGLLDAQAIRAAIALVP